MSEAAAIGAGPAPACPKCNGALAGGSRFVEWCPSCEWNLDPGGEAELPEPTGWRGRRARAETDKAATRGDALFAQVSTEGDVARPSSGATRAATAVGAVVLAADALVIALGLGVAVATWFEPISIFALLFALGGIAAMGRPGKRAPGTRLLPSDAPILFGLCDDIGRQIGTRAPDEIIVANGFNASIGRVGVRGRRVITLGVPLWSLLDDQQRVALLAHELGHEANGDPSRGLVVGLAVSSLQRWAFLLQPPSSEAMSRASAYRGARRGASINALTSIAQAIAALVMLPISASLLLAGRGLRRLRARGGNRAEYVADQLAAQVAGSAATIEMLQQLLLVPSCARALENRRARGERGDVLEFLRRHVATLPLSERDRLTRIAERRRTGVDATHPPTASRIALLSGRPGVRPALVLGQTRAVAINRELEPATNEVLGRAPSPAKR